MADYRTFLLAQLGLTTSQLSNTDLERLYWAQGGSGGASDGSVASYVSDPTSQTATALSNKYSTLESTQRGGAKVYVSLDGNDGLYAGTSWAFAKRTVAAAVASLPTFTASGVTYHAGTVEIGRGLFVEQGLLEANTEIRYIGANTNSGQTGTKIQLAAGRNCDVFRYQQAWGDAGGFAHGLSFENLTIDGNAAAQGATTLAAAITSTTATTMTVTANASFPQSGTFDVAIDGEIVTVTAGAGTNTWTIVRGQGASGAAFQGATLAATHANGAAVHFAGSCIRIFGGGFNCRTVNTFVINAGYGVRIDGAAVNYVGHDFHASTMYGPAFAYTPMSWASGCMIAFSGTGQIDDCGDEPMVFVGSQNGTAAVSIHAMKFESRVSSTKHKHCIVYRSALDSGSSPSFTINSVSAYALGGGRESVIYDYAGTNGQGAAWDLHGIVGTDGYTEAFYSARQGIHSNQVAIGSLSVANADSGAPGCFGTIQIGTTRVYSNPFNAPEGQITANPGSVFSYTGGNPGPTLYVKSTGTGNTGWLPLQVVASGATGSRPTGVPAGWQYFDTTLGKPVWLKTGTTWVDATGATV